MSYNVSDPESILFDDQGISVDNWTLFNSSDNWIEGLEFEITGSNGIYIITIKNNVYNNIGTYSFDVEVASDNVIYGSASNYDISFTIRSLTTSISYIPPVPQPFGNNVSIQLYYNISDSASSIYNRLGLNASNWILSNISATWTEGVEYIVSGNNSIYSIIIINNVYNTIGAFSFDIQVSTGNPIHEIAVFNGISYTIRALTTSLIYLPPTPEPFGNNISISIQVNVSDPASTLYNGLGLDIDTWTLSNISGTWTDGIEYIISGNSGIYTLTVINNVYDNIGTYSFDIQATTLNTIYSSTKFNNMQFSIRALTTTIIYNPILPVPFGNNISLEISINVSDSASILFDGIGLNVNSWTFSNISNVWTENCILLNLVDE
jgi:hypothetical protein